MHLEPEFASVIFILLTRYLLFPIRILTRQTRKIQEGTRHEIEIRTKDEIGELAKAFSNLLHQLEKKTEDVRKSREEVVLMNHSLEDRVKEQTKRLEMALVKAEDATKAKSQFLAMMSHELRTPMNGVIGMADLLSGSRLDSEQKDCVTTIKKCSESLSMIIKDILDFSKIESGKLDLENSPFDLREIVDTAIKVCSLKIGVKDIELQVDISDDVPNKFKGDAQRVAQVLMNIVDNAIKFTNKGKIAVRVRLENVIEEDATLRFEVQDPGIGIDKHYFKNIFDQFYQLDESMTRKYGGTGLGLAVSKKIVEAMGGEIGVQSEIGHGSTFWFVINLKHIVETKVEHASKLEPDLNHNTPVLVVEDNKVNQKVVGKMLNKIGYETVFADNGKIGVELFKKDRYAFILMDIQMPVMDGLQAAVEMRNIERDSKEKSFIFALTANATEGDRENCKKAGMDGFMSKPLKLTELKRTIQDKVSMF